MQNIIKGIALSLLANQIASAAVLPNAALPEQLSKSLTARQPAKASSLAPPIAETPQQKPSPASAQAQKITFTLNKIILRGNHVYSPETLEKLYQNKLHKKISVAELFGITQDITNFYRNNGYIISQALLLPQHIKNGIVQITVIEGFINNTTVIGKPNGARKRVAIYGNQIRQNRPLQIAQMQKYLLLANEIPGTSVRAVLSAAKNATGGSDLSLVTENKPLNGYISYDNYGTRYTGPLEATANAGLNSIALSGDSTQVTVVKTTKGGELRYVDTNYSFPITPDGSRITIGGTRIHTHPLFFLTSSDINGQTLSNYANLLVPVIRAPTQSLNLQASFSYANTATHSFNDLLYEDFIRSLEFGANYNFIDRFRGSNAISAGYRVGLPALGYTTDTRSTALTSRPGGYARYSKITFQTSRVQSIKGPFSLYALLKGQKGFQPLLAGEQFAFGGSQLGRGYDAAEILGDKGLAGSLELRYDWNLGYSWLQAMQLYTFYDAGVIWNYHNAVSSVFKQGATSTGIGSRLFVNQHVSGNLMFTQPLTKQVAAQSLIDRGSAPRVFFSIQATV